jgi:hypothetical protein
MAMLVSGPDEVMVAGAAELVATLVATSTLVKPRVRAKNVERRRDHPW